MNGTSASDTGCVSLTNCVFFHHMPDLELPLETHPYLQGKQMLSNPCISSALLARAMPKIYHWHIRNRTTQAESRRPFSAHRQKGLFCKSYLEARQNKNSAWDHFSHSLHTTNCCSDTSKTENPLWKD